MVSTIRVKWGGTTWQGPITDGNLRLNWDGAWTYPTKVMVKNGPVGSGVWVDTSYQSYPMVPPAPTVNTWNNTSFNQVSIKWGAPPAGGAPTVSYDEEMLDSAGNRYLSQYYSGVSSPSGNFPASPDGQYQFRVRSRSASGLVSAWSPVLKVQMGHAEVGHNVTDNLTRPWTSAAATGGRNKDAPFEIGFGSNFVVQTIRISNLHSYNNGMSIMSPYGNRTINWWFYGAVGAPINDNFGQVNTGFTGYLSGFGHAGDGRGWGIIPRGTGWSTSGNIVYQALCDAVYLEGYENYTQQRYVIDTAYKANGYW